VSHLDKFFENLPERLDVKEVAELLGVSIQGVYTWLRNGTVPGYQIGRSWVILRDELKEVLEAGRGGPGSAPSDSA
jgi:excisionase family DNA binding protein